MIPIHQGDEGDMYDDLTQQDQDHLNHNTNEVGYSYNIFFSLTKEQRKKSFSVKEVQEHESARIKSTSFRSTRRRDRIQMMNPVVLMA